MREVFIAGVGMTRFAKQPDRSLKDLAGESVRGAMADAGISVHDIEAAYFSNAIAGSILGQEMIAGQVALRGSVGLQGVPIINVENACASASTALNLGWQTVASGQADCVLCVGAEKMTHPDKDRSLMAIGGAVDVEAVFGPEGQQPGGRSYFMDIYAAEAVEYMERTGATAQDFAAVAVKNHHHGGMNALAQYGSEMTVEEVLSGREIVYPLTLTMCSPLSDGSAAAILMSKDVLRGNGRPRVKIAASVIASGVKKGGEDASAVARACRIAYERAGLGPEDLDMVELHDATASAEIPLYESLGLAADGEGPGLIRDKATVLGGRLPVNVSGGLLSKGHPIGASGLAQIYESVLHLTGRAGKRQVDGARVALAQNGGGWIEGDNAAAGVTVLQRVES